MRILLTHHFPLGSDAAGRFAMKLAQGLLAAGHEARALVIDDAESANGELRVRRVAIPVPRFAPHGVAPLTFHSLSDAQIDDHRDELRRALDAEIEAFNPHVVHAQHIWLLGHLALEMGVPYVLSAWEAELAVCRADARYERYAQEAAENAGRILVSSPRLVAEITAQFGDLDGRLATAENEQAWLADGCARTLDIYRDVISTRFGACGGPTS